MQATPSFATDQSIQGPRGGPLLGFANLFRKEVQEWFRGRRGLVVGLSAVAIGLFTVLIPFIVKATDRMGTAPAFSMDPTANVLLGWGSGTVTFQSFLVVLATIGLMTVERDRGTLAWTLTNPVSRTALLFAKWAAAVAVLGVISIVLPLALQVVVAAVAYGAIADLPLVAGFALLYLTVPAFYVALTLATGTVVSSTAGVAGVAFLVMFLPALIAPVAPSLVEFSPTGVHLWAYGLVTGSPVVWTLPLATALAIVFLGLGARVAFERQDF
jgi:ABC-2 type transport system permease protein